MKKDQLWTKFKQHCLNEGLSDSRINKLLTMYKVIQRGITVDLDKATRKEIESFVNKLNADEFLSTKGKPYSGNSKSDIKKFLKQFYKWIHGDNEHYPPSVSWIKARIRKDERPEEKPVITIKQVSELASTFTKLQYRIMTLLLYDSGFRIQELMSVKKADLTFENFDDNNKCWWIKCSKSKTIPRKVDVPLFTDEINAFVNNPYYSSRSNNDLLFEVNAPAYRKALAKNSEAHLKVRITPHCLRHSSATYYAREYDGDMILLGNRYGWSYSAKELKTYVRRSGAMQKKAAKKIFTNEAVKLRGENAELRERLEKLEKARENTVKEVKELLLKQIKDGTFFGEFGKEALK